MTANDLTTENGILAWLRASRFKDGKRATLVERLSEGFTGFVYRAHLKNASYESVIVKHAEEYAARSSSWKLDRNRMHYEYEGLQYLSKLPVESHLKVRTPEVLFYDPNDFVLVIEDVGQLPSVKSWLQPGTGFEPARAVGNALGQYLAVVHNSTAAAHGTKASFNGNTTAKYLSSTLYFGRFPAAAAAFGHTGDYLHEASQVGQQEVNEANEVLTLGDFWTGNVLIDATESCKPRLFVLDLELAKPGTAAFDIGQMAAEMYCLQVFRNTPAGKSLLEAFLQSYRRTRDVTVDAAKVAIRIGAHMLVVMPRAWEAESSPEGVGNLVAEGVGLIRLGWGRNHDGLRKSIVAPLMV